MKKFQFILFSLFTFISCTITESKFEVISERELIEYGINDSFKNRILQRDEKGKIISPNENLKKLGFELLTDGDDSWIRKIKYGNKIYELDYPLYHTYIFEDHVIFFTGMIGIESGFFRYFITPKHAQLITFEKENFEYINKKVIYGMVRNVNIVDSKVYFAVEKESEFSYGRYSLLREEKR